jgi:hypothetical protein
VLFFSTFGHTKLSSQTLTRILSQHIGPSVATAQQLLDGYVDTGSLKRTTTGCARKTQTIPSPEQQDSYTSTEQHLAGSTDSTWKAGSTSHMAGANGLQPFCGKRRFWNVRRALCGRLS